MQGMRSGIVASLLLGLSLATPAAAQDLNAITYQQPPAPIAQILDTPPSPAPSLSPTRQTLALLGRSNLPPIAELAEPELRLAGFRINPRNNAPANSRLAWLNSLTLQDVATGRQRPVRLPTGFRFVAPNWSPDGRQVAMLRGVDNGLELWVADVASATARKLDAPMVNAAFGTGFDWLPDSSAILIRAIPRGRGAAPSDRQAPTGPIVQENEGRTAPVRTFQDLLRNASDERLFDHYFTSQLTLVPMSGGAPRTVGAPGVVTSFDVSPDGRFLLQNRVKRPYAYTVPAALFPTEILVTDLTGRLVHRLADLPLRDDIPTQFDAVAPGPREAQWRADAPSTLVWAEAQDGGDVRREAAVRDRLFMLPAPFNGRPTTLVDLPHRFRGVIWGRDDFAIAISTIFNSRQEIRNAVNPSRPGETRVLLTRNFQDRLNDPGMPLMRPTPRGTTVMHFTADGGGVFMTSPGATRQGELPFLDRMDLATGQTQRLWRAEMPHHESVVGLLDDSANRFVTRRESRDEPSNLFLRDRAGGQLTHLTDFPDPAPQLAGVTPRLITYKRKDGVELSGTLYLPAGHDPARDGPLPVLLWAYPNEFTDARVAGQVVDDSANRFSRPSGSSPLFLLTQGYAVLDDPKMPVVGRDGAEPNDTFIEQLISSAQAAVDELVRLGVTTPDRVAVGGHSYGAFMTANLLAHSDIFRTGIARSGAYNRTLTPFGFQSEQRSFWEAPETYMKMSPFGFVQQMNEPILLIHGETDANPGTFPIQTERLFAALRGNGKNARYVVLPLEDHGYRARESVGHAIWEMSTWLDRHLKNAPPREAAVAASAAAATKE
jgi:dipeptidyl aminopeptidase/acylaminoacyl peptidase